MDCMVDQHSPRSREHSNEIQSGKVSRRRVLQLGCGAALGGLTMSGLGSMAMAAVRAERVSGLGSSRFCVGEFLPFRSYRDGSGVVHTSRAYVDEAWFESLGLLPVNVVYSSRFLDGTGLDAALNAENLRKIALQASPAYPVSLDAEEWDEKRFTPGAPTSNGKSIVQNLVDVVRTFKNANPAADVGLYSELPQNTYGFTDTTEAVHDRLNPQYAEVAALVDYYSPSLYNYRYDGTPAGDQRWVRAAAYAVHACRLLDSLNHTNKPILPYITPAWTDAAKNTRYLSYEQMVWRLQMLMRLGANGCILWLSSSAKEPSGDGSLVLDPNQGWLKAAVDTARYSMK
jgi:hypothetical protein